MVKVYGRDMAQTILANMRSNIVLGGSRLGDETLDQMSRSLGEIEGEVERKESDPQKPWIVRKRRDVKVVRAVTPTEISMCQTSPAIWRCLVICPSLSSRLNTLNTIAKTLFLALN
nr:TraM recognition domain-containing protein [Shigella flexneri]